MLSETIAVVFFSTNWADRNDPSVRFSGGINDLPLSSLAMAFPADGGPAPQDGGAAGGDQLSLLGGSDREVHVP